MDQRLSDPTVSGAKTPPNASHQDQQNEEQLKRAVFQLKRGPYADLRQLLGCKSE